METSGESGKRPKPCTKLDFLAERVLSSCAICDELTEKHFHDQQDEDHPYIFALEKVLGIHQISLIEKSLHTTPESQSSTAGLLTCTDVSSFHQNENANGNGAETSQLPKFWSPPISNTNAIESSTSVWPILEDAAPFSKEFYFCVGELIVCGLSPTTLATVANDAVTEGGDRNEIESEDYSLFKERVDVRVTRILSTLMRIDIDGEDGAGFNICDRKCMNTTHEYDFVEMDDGVTFLDLLLHHAEESTHITKNKNHPSEMEVCATTIGRKVPIMHAIFKCFGSLPQLESHLYTKIRIFRNSFKALSTTTCRSAHKNLATLKIEHMKKAETFQERLQHEFKRHVSTIEIIAGTIYERCDSTLRKKARIKIGTLLHNFAISQSGSQGGGGYFGVENTCAASIDTLLQILLRILRGSALNKDKDLALFEPYKQLLSSVLLPLHKPSGMVLWRDQTPLLGLYHKTLVQCIGTIVGSNHDLIGIVIKYIIHPDVWPMEGKAGKTANTPKLVLLLHEIDTLLGLLDIEDDKTVCTNFMSESVVPLVLRLSSCISSDNSRSSERALEFFKNKKFTYLIKSNISRTMTPLLRALCRMDNGMELPWNPTVRKMSSVVLEQLESYDASIFEMSCRDLFVSSSTTMTSDVVEEESTSSKKKSSLISSHDESPSSDMISLKSAMGGWRPPTKNTSNLNKERGRRTGVSMMPPPMSRPTNGQTKAQPPLTVTGVAPWAVNKNNGQAKVQPPLTVTGVAPWAVKRGGTGPSNGAMGRRTTTKTPRLVPSHSKISPNSGSDSAASTLIKTQTNKLTKIDALSKVRAYMKSLKPNSDGTEESEDGVSSWAKAQMSESPVLLPTLKFHDLVFGQVLGTGAFSSVKYARKITKGKTRSHWPEYAVKIVSTQKIEELGYEKSVNREISILQTMSHPGISRLISSFRFRDGAYMILEYASGGDLHTLLKRNGSLDEESTRFVIGEIVAALDYIHELDFVYGDLKPENILITEIGHIKLTDFGGCRPLTDAARRFVRNAGKNVLKNLRDGDWRISNIEGSTGENKTSVKDQEDENDESDDDDNRVEGTTAYLPPEVVLGGIPSKASDSWSLGCCVFQCLSGRPPLLDTTENTTRQKIVTFQLNHSDSNSDTERDFFLERNGSSSFSSDSKILIKSLLAKNPIERPSMSVVADFDFFNGIDLFSLHRRPPHPLDSGNVGPSPDAQWSRRQFSSIWAPQPQEYVISNAKSTTDMTFDKLHTPIIEGEEREGHFLSNGVGTKTALMGILER